MGVTAVVAKAVKHPIFGALHGVENICRLNGDEVTAGDELQARRVFDLDGPQLVNGSLGRLGRLCADLDLSPRPERESHEHRSAVSV